jgi:hypothetical protein
MRFFDLQIHRVLFLGRGSDTWTASELNEAPRNSAEHGQRSCLHAPFPPRTSMSQWTDRKHRVGRMQQRAAGPSWTCSATSMPPRIDRSEAPGV